MPGTVIVIQNNSRLNKCSVFNMRSESSNQGRGCNGEHRKERNSRMVLTESELIKFVLQIVKGREVNAVSWVL
jgi:hypothetical protein